MNVWWSSDDTPREEISPPVGTVQILEEEEPFPDYKIRIDDIYMDGEDFFTQAG
jgi:hypothetical protein